MSPLPISGLLYTRGSGYKIKFLLLNDQKINTLLEKIRDKLVYSRFCIPIEIIANTHIDYCDFLGNILSVSSTIDATIFILDPEDTDMVIAIHYNFYTWRAEAVEKMSRSYIEISDKRINNMSLVVRMI